MNLYDPSQWVDPSGLAMIGLVVLGTVLLLAVKIAGERWDDWLDEPRGRGSVRDDWPFGPPPKRR